MEDDVEKDETPRVSLLPKETEVKTEALKEYQRVKTLISEESPSIDSLDTYVEAINNFNDKYSSEGKSLGYALQKEYERVDKELKAKIKLQRYRS